jgi:hypothetical protein
LKQTGIIFFEQAKPGNFLPDHRLTDTPGFVCAAPAVSPLSAWGGFYFPRQEIAVLPLSGVGL